MAYLAFYRMFRPTTFDEVVRQEHIVRILKNQIESDKVGHAYLFCGPRGTGKTSLAKIFARAINCEHPVNGSPCGKCASCLALADPSNLDVCEIDAASNNGVDEMRDLREKVQYPPVGGRYKVYIIDEVHMLTQSAFNAVLKTLEEPPRHAVFILATTEPQKIPATILSRCMRFDFKLIPQADLENLIKGVFEKTGKQYEPSAVSAIARAGAGSARDSLSIADMCASYSRGKLTYDDVNAVLGGAEWSEIAEVSAKILQEDYSSAISLVEHILSTGKGVGVLLKDMLSFLNDLTIVKVCKNAREIINRPDETYNKIESISQFADGHKLLRVTEILTAAENSLRYSSNGRITLETAVFKAAMPQSDYDIDALIGRMTALERKIAERAYTPEYGAVTPQNPPKPQPPKTAQMPKKAHPAEFVSSKPELVEDSGGNPFESVEKQTEIAVQSKIPPNISGVDKRTVFAKFLRSLRTTHVNKMLFLLCMDLDHEFEGDKLIFITDNEAVPGGLNKPENAKFISEALAELGVLDYEVRFRARGENDYERAVRTLKENFSGTDIDIK